MDDAGAGVTGALGRARWTPSTMTCSPSFRPSSNAGRLRRHLAEAHPALPGDILVVDDIHVAALLIGEDRGARHGDDRLRLHGFKKDGDELVGDKLAKVDTARRLLPPDGIRNDPAEQETCRCPVRPRC